MSFIYLRGDVVPYILPDPVSKFLKEDLLLDIVWLINNLEIIHLSSNTIYPSLWQGLESVYAHDCGESSAIGRWKT